MVSGKFRCSLERKMGQEGDKVPFPVLVLVGSCQLRKEGHGARLRGPIASGHILG